MEELIEMREQEQDIEEFLNFVQSEGRMAVGNLTEGLGLNEKGLQILENIDFNAKMAQRYQANGSHWEAIAVLTSPKPIPSPERINRFHIEVYGESMIG
ncbi:hypothetical protein TNCV_1486011 [Trichonephila clavipes]|nr:hypothetical protein TNCV_1486011 [Trichonephila clavipes]